MLDKFKNIKPKPAKKPVGDDVDGYFDTLDALKPRPDIKKVLYSLGTVAAVLAVTFVVVLWAVIGGGVRSNKSEDEVIILAGDTQTGEQTDGPDKNEDKTPDGDVNEQIHLPNIPATEKVDDTAAAEKVDDTPPVENGDTEKKNTYPFAKISADDIKEVFFGLQEFYPRYECTKTYTDADAIAKIVEFLNKAPMTEDGSNAPFIVGSPPYVIELRGADGAPKYSIRFTNKYQPGYLCCFDDDSAEKDIEFFVDSNYLYDLVYYIATLDGREPMWVYSPIFMDDLIVDQVASVVFESEDTVKEYNNEEKYPLFSHLLYFRSLHARLATDKDEKWNNDSTLEQYTASFYDADKKLICKFVTNGYIEDDNRYQLMFYVGDDTKGTQYAAIKRQFDIFMNYAKGGFDGYM